MCLFVTGVGTLIHIYAIGYMHGDPKFSKFFLYLNLFAFSMLLLVLGENLLVTFVGWEGVGTCSYLLISFWHTRAVGRPAGKKAFVTNRVGDWGFMVAMFLAFGAVGSLSYSVVNGAAIQGSLAQSTATAIAAMLFVGAVGKSAQLPLYLWLPDAMEGPTPVSALIHAATMVTAGVFLMVRMNPVLSVAADWLPTTIAWIGVITALFAATIAIAQNDIKKVLAYSTVSQLGYMFLAVGSGAYVAAIFHMITHAFFKALLFLGSGSVIHGMHDEQDMRRMGRLRALLPVTAMTFIFGWLAIAGVPPFAGFWSKDEILLFSLAKSPALYLLGLVTALLTAYYMTRQVVMVFFGEAKWEDHAARARRPRRVQAARVPADHAGAAGGPGRAVDRSAGSSSCRSPTTWGASPAGWSPVGRVRRGRHRGDLGRRPPVPADGHRRRRRPRRHRRRLPRVPAPPGQGDRAGGARQRLVLRPDGHRLHGRPRVRGVRRRRRGSTATSSTAPSTAPGALVRAHCRRAAPRPERVRARVRRDHRRRRRRDARLVRHPRVRLMDATQFPILTAIVLLPVFGAVARGDHAEPATRPGAPRRPRHRRDHRRAEIWLLANFDTGDAGFQFVSIHEWIPEWGISWHLGVDGISLLLVVLTGVLFPIAILGADPHPADAGPEAPDAAGKAAALGSNLKQYYGWMLVLEAGVLGSFLSLDLFVFFVFFEIVLVPMYFLIGGWGYADRLYAARKFFLFTMFGSAFMLVGIIATVFIARDNGVGAITFDLTRDRRTGRLPHRHGALAVLRLRHRLRRQGAPLPAAHVAPDAHTQAPTAGSVILAGVMLKLGTYGLLRFGLYLFPAAAHWARPLMLTLAVIGILYGAIVATMQTDLKRLVAYSSIAHLGFIVLGTFAMTSQAITGAVLQNINHGISTGALFLLVGWIYERRHTREISELKGLQAVAPIFAAGFTDRDALVDRRARAQRVRRRVPRR